MVGLDLDLAQAFPDRDSVLAEHLSLCQAVDLADEAPGVERERVAAFLELVKLLDNGYRNDDVVVLELPDSLVVMQDDVGVQHEYLGLSMGFSPRRDIGVSWHICYVVSLLLLNSGCV